MPKVSVIIPCYNHGQYLDEAVDSVLAQTYQEFEIIVVNDGSTDEFTNKLLANYNKRKTRVLNQNNQGLPCTRNNGIKVSSGEYIVCLDADDSVHPEFLSKTIPILDADTEHQYGFVMPWVQLFGEMNFIWETSEYDPYLVCMRNGMHPAAPFRRECWDAAGGYNENMKYGYEDWDFWVTIAALGYRWVTLKEPLINYRKSVESMLVNANKKKLMLYREIIRNHENYYRTNFEEILVRGMEYFDYKLKMYEGALASKDDVKNIVPKAMKELEAIRSSLSWKVTAPFRTIFSLLRKGKV